MTEVDRSNVGQSRANYLQRMWENGLRPIIYLVDGRVWPTVEACSQDIGYSTALIVYECIMEDGYFAFFPEYFWGRWKTAGASDQYREELRCIDAGVMFGVNPKIVRQAIKLRSLEQDLEEIPELITMAQEDPERKERMGIPVLDQTTWTLYPSISSCARGIGVTRKAIYDALARDGRVKGHKLIL